MIKIDLLKNQPDAIPILASIWYEVLGKSSLPDVKVQRVILGLQDRMNHQTLPITFVALDDDMPVGMCSLCTYDGIRSDLTPWLSSLVVTPKHQGKQIGKTLIDTARLKAKDLGFEKLYLFAFDPSIPEYYKRLGWMKIGMDEFKSHRVTVMEVEL